jgi:hypothetical protein
VTAVTTTRAESARETADTFGILHFFASAGPPADVSAVLANRLAAIERAAQTGVRQTLTAPDHTEGKMAAPLPARYGHVTGDLAEPGAPYTTGGGAPVVEPFRGRLHRELGMLGVIATTRDEFARVLRSVRKALAVTSADAALPVSSQPGFQGLMSSIPVSSKSAVLRVASMAPRSRQMAAI